MILLDGREVADKQKNELAEKVKSELLLKKRAPGLAVILIGNDPASEVYVRNKIRACEKVGFKSFHYHLKQDVKEEEIVTLIKSLNQNSEVDGILLQLPVPKHLNGMELIDLISPEKDPDCLTSFNMGRLLQGEQLISSCTPAGAIEILKHYKIEIESKNVVVIGRSNIVGKPMGQLLTQSNATVTLCHSKTEDIKSLTQKADIIVTAVGDPKCFGPEYFSQNAVIIDVGITRLENGKLSGDVDFENVKNKVKAITPVPGGVGPMTITMLLKNTFSLYQRHFD